MAAGGSTRMGTAKAVLPWADSTLIQIAIGRMVDADLAPIVVVTGADADVVEPMIDRSVATVAHNANWKQGQASSLAVGLNAVIGHAGGVVVTLVDQPGIDAKHLLELTRRGRGRRAAATRYRSGGGVPAWFSAGVLKEVLSSLNDDDGAKTWLRSRPAGEVALVDCPATGDIDTPADYR